MAARTARPQGTEIKCVAGEGESGVGLGWVGLFSTPIQAYV